MEKKNDQEIDPTGTDDQGQIMKLSRVRSLTSYYNAHLHKMIAAELNIKVLEKKPRDEVIAQRLVNVQGADRPVIQTIKAGAELETQRKLYNDNRELLEAAELLLKTEAAVITSKVEDKSDKTG